MTALYITTCTRTVAVFTFHISAFHLFVYLLIKDNITMHICQCCCMNVLFCDMVFLSLDFTELPVS